MLTPDITTEMIQAGDQISSDMMSASVSKNMGGLGGSKTWKEFYKSKPDNLDLLERYANDELTSVECIFIAMCRVSQNLYSM